MSEAFEKKKNKTKIKFACCEQFAEHDRISFQMMLWFSSPIDESDRHIVRSIGYEYTRIIYIQLEIKIVYCSVIMSVLRSLYSLSRHKRSI